ncbi:phage tail tape measure protein [Frigoribacterium sp. PhB24]|uniref:phage tail tape measure protein n=1 Tax=Frigoribacterium sp. PhB24 TaxID=2485204 RepID=UPI000F488BB0|nr:phage tail tape measure protein [Frigoribacterium sp. PhB24]ROS52923.1 TP901 family phage tail tape measure protein [Frigoribacterium sp. PhB24]
MAERSVKVNVGANLSGLVSEFQKGRKAATDFSQGLTKELTRNQADFEQVGKGFAVAGAAGVLALGAIVSKSSEFDQAMSFVQAGTHETTANMGLLRAAAIDAGASTVFSATESANAIEELGKSGLSTKDILAGGLSGSLDLAAAGGLGVARAAEIASTTLQQFKLDGSQAGRVADTLAAGAGKAMGSVEDLAQGLKFVGPVAQSMGVSLEETTGTLALFAQAGILGEQGGTSLRGVLSSLTAPSGAAAEEIKRLGLNLYDANGKFLGLSNAAGQLAGAYRGMDDESRNASLGIIFGRETITAATALYQAGSEGVDQWTKSVTDSGYATETAAIRLDNLRGDVEALGGAFDTALIQTGENADGALRGLVQTGTNLIDVYNGAPEVLKGTTFNLLAVGTAAAIAGTAFFIGAPKLVEYRNAISTLKTEAPLATKAIGAFGKGFAALAVISVAIPLLNEANKQINGLQSSSDELTNTLKTQKIGDALKESVGDVDGVFSKGFFGEQTNALKDFGATLDAVSSSADTRSFGVFGDVFTGKAGSGVNEVRNRLEALGSSLSGLPLDEAQAKVSKLQKEYKLTDDQLFSFIDNSGEFKNSLVAQATELGLTADKATLLKLATGEMSGATEEQTQALSELSGSAQDASVDIDDLKATIEGFGSAQLNVNSATRDFEAAVDDLSASVTENGSTLDVSTAKGRANQAALDDIAKSTLGLSSATLTQTGSQQQASAALATGRQRLIEALAQFGITGAAAEQYADKLGLIPSNISTAARLTGVAAAEAQITQLARDRAVSLNIRVNESISAANRAGGAKSTVGGVPFAEGGPVRGPGTGTSDSIRAWLSNGEHVWTAREVAAAGGHGSVMALRREILASRRAPGFAGGGPVGSSVAPRYAPPTFAPRVSVAAAPVSIDAPIVADGTLLGFVRGVAGQEIQFALATEEQRMNQRWRKT